MKESQPKKNHLIESLTDFAHDLGIPYSVEDLTAMLTLKPVEPKKQVQQDIPEKPTSSPSSKEQT
jgi:hypothetical protein